jgi:hypothetical protein
MASAEQGSKRRASRPPVNPRPTHLFGTSHVPRTLHFETLTGHVRQLLGSRRGARSQQPRVEVALSDLPRRPPPGAETPATAAQEADRATEHGPGEEAERRHSWNGTPRASEVAAAGWADQGQALADDSAAQFCGMKITQGRSLVDPTTVDLVNRDKSCPESSFS